MKHDDSYYYCVFKLHWAIIQLSKEIHRFVSTSSISSNLSVVKVVLNK